MSPRRTARETALLVLFAIDVGKANGEQGSVDEFLGHFKDDTEVIAELLGYSEYEPAPADVLSRAQMFCA